MGFRSKLTTTVAACALLAGAGSAQAQSPKVGPQAGAVRAAAAYIGITVQELRLELKDGNSLANAALKHGKSVEGLRAAIVADAKAQLDKAVDAGKLTADRAAQILQRLKTNVAAIVMRTGSLRGKGTPARGKAVAAYRGAVRSAAGYLGLTLTELRTQLQAGRSLAQVATAEGKSVEGLKAAIVADAKAVIDKLVAAGKIPAERGQRYLEQIQAHLDQLVNRTGPAGRP